MYTPKGVRINHEDNISTNRVYIDSCKKRVPKGVMNERIQYYYRSIGKIITLLYNKPCVCGSLQHSRTTHPDCLVNDKYNDV